MAGDGAVAASEHGGHDLRVQRRRGMPDLDPHVLAMQAPGHDAPRDRGRVEPAAAQLVAADPPVLAGGDASHQHVGGCVEWPSTRDTHSTHPRDLRTGRA